MTETVVAATNGRPSLQHGAVSLMLAVEFIALIMSWILFGIDFWLPLQFGIIVAWMLTQARSPTAAMILGNGALGMAYAHYLAGFVLWPSTVLGVLAVLIMSLNLVGNTTTAGDGARSTSTNSDSNPIAYIIAIIAVRAYLATTYTSVSEITSLSDNFLNWITIFVIGVIPGVPTLVNVILFFLLNGSLAVYLVLLLKRIANPVAN